MTIKIKHIIFLVILLITISAQKSFSQQAVLRGFVYDKETGEPIIFTNVYFKGTTIGGSTDQNGFYNISKINPGTYTLMITSLGFDTLREDITLKANDIITKKLNLTRSAVNLSTINISAKNEDARNDVQMSVTKATPREISQVPSVGGQPDLAQYLSVIPGVIFTGDQGGQLYVRGGSPIQNKVLIDGMVIYNPFHSIGLFSVFDMDLIRNVEVNTGGFNAQYGGRISSVMDITTRDGNKNRFAGKVGVSPFGAKMLFEGPLGSRKDKKASSSSFIFSAKNSYLQETSKTIYSYVDTAGLPFNYLDLYGKLSFNSENGSKINFFGFNFDDKVHYEGISDFHWQASGGGSNFVLIPSSTAMLMEGNFSYSKYKIGLEEVNSAPRTSEINGFSLGFNFSYFYGKNTLNYGFDVLGFKTVFNFYNSVDRKIEQNDNTTEIAAFLKYRISKEKFVLEPGFRLHYYASLSNASPEPRIGIKYNLSDRLRLKASGGMYSQNLISATSDRDIVNLFYGFLSGPDNLQEEFDGKPVTHKLQKATHGIFGFEYDLFAFIELNVEAYIKNFNQLTNINRNKIYDDNGDNYEKPDYLKKDFIIEKGVAKGIDVSLKWETRKFYFWTAYSLGYVNRYDGIITYNPHYDRRHNVNLLGVYRFGKKLKWEFDARWNLGSGFPFTQTQGFYNNVNFNNGIGTDVSTANGDLGIQYSEYNKARLPYYHRLDFSLKREFELKKKAKLEVVVSATNVYDRNNIFYISRTKQEPVYQLPILPSIGINLTF
ncbi:MAG: TonB-dependent receptor [Bacteroidota bacterium]